MPRLGLWRNNDGTRKGKYLVQRRDGSIPEWPYFVIAASDPNAPAALRAYAAAALEHDMPGEYVDDIYELADRFEAYCLEHKPGNPYAPRHREDDPATMELMRQVNP